MTAAAFGPAIALMAVLGAFVAALAIIAARSLFVICVALAVLGAMTATALLGLRMEDAALATALSGVGLAPLLYLGAIVLSGRSARSYPRGSYLLTGVACFVLAVAIVASLSGFLAASDNAVAFPQPPGVSALLGVVVFVGVLVGVGLLGYGERGLLARGRGDRP